MGKAKSLSRRVRSYFQSPVKLGFKTAKLVSLITEVEHIQVQSEIEALLLESRLIRKFQPPYNITSKDDKSPFYIHTTGEKFPRPEVNHLAKRAVAGPFFNRSVPGKILRQLRKIAPYCMAKNPKRPCLYAHLGLCRPCPGEKDCDIERYLCNIRRLRGLLGGKFGRVRAGLKRQMVSLASKKEYEAAAAARNQLQNLEYLLSRPVPPDEYIVNPNLVYDKRRTAVESLEKALGLDGLGRIEMYDVANISGAAATGAMAVAIDGEVSPRWFRHFTIRGKSTPDDVGMMKEILTRRLKRTDWPKPDLIVLDGGKSQLSIVSWEVPTIALAKQQEIIVIKHRDGFDELRLAYDHPGLLLLMRLRDEAHRFSRRLHHKHRNIIT